MGMCTRQRKRKVGEAGKEGDREGERERGGGYKLAPAFPGLIKVRPLSMFKIFSGQNNLRQGGEKARAVLDLPCPRHPEVQHRSASRKPE